MRSPSAPGRDSNVVMGPPVAGGGQRPSKDSNLSNHPDRVNATFSATRG
jgi:hypothetical protein